MLSGDSPLEARDDKKCITELGYLVAMAMIGSQNRRSHVVELNHQNQHDIISIMGRKFAMEGTGG